MIYFAKFCIFSSEILRNSTMIPQKKDTSQLGFLSSFEDTLSQRHPLHILAEKIDRQQFEAAFLPLYCPAKLIRLLMLKHIRNISDENVVDQWSENCYYQYFCGQTSFVPEIPCEASELVHFRKPIGEDGIALILKESIRINEDDSNHPYVNVDTTVEKKNITFPADSKLHRKIIKKRHHITVNHFFWLFFPGYT